MELKRNIFEYATKELAQDAFLRWLIENIDSEHEDIRRTSATLICTFLGLEYNETVHIDDVDACSQERKIDILVKLRVNQEKHMIAIEDKTDSHEHSNQLDKYKDYLMNKYPDYTKHYVFYKTSPMHDDETTYITSKEWQVYDIEKIYRIFTTLDFPIENYLLKSYIEHIKNLHKKFKGNLPVDIKEWSIKHWQNYSLKQNILVPEDMESKIYNYRNQYYGFAYNFKDQWNKNPCIEFRSRDVSRDDFSMRIFIYENIDSLSREKIEKWKEQIRRSQLYKTQNHKLQIGLGKPNEKIVTIEDLETNVTKYIEEFQKIMNPKL